MHTPKICPTRHSERGCTQDCEQGRRCTCTPENANTLTAGEWGKLALVAAALVAAACVVAVLLVVAPSSVAHVMGG